MGTGLEGKAGFFCSWGYTSVKKPLQLPLGMILSLAVQSPPPDLRGKERKGIIAIGLLKA